MKFIHLSDLHLGKRVNGFSMTEDQEYILNRIIDIIDLEKPQGALIAGDIYDKPVPPPEAVRLFDDFLFRLSERGIRAFIISGNHDSAERIAFGSRLIDKSGIHLSPVYRGAVTPVRLHDEYGSVAVFMLPFIRPAHVRRFFPDADIRSYTDALRTALSGIELDPAERSILLTHQFVTGAARSESEDISVGGADNVDASVFDAFDYTALGHIHRPQSIERETVRYCGTPLKYSFSEKDHDKSATIVELGEKGSIEIRTIPLKPLHDMREIRGSYDELTLRRNYEGTATDDYIHAVLTDEEDVPNAVGRLRAVYPNLMKLDYDNTRTKSSAELEAVSSAERVSETELFAGFFKIRNGHEMSDEQTAFATELFESIREEER